MLLVQKKNKINIVGNLLKVLSGQLTEDYQVVRIKEDQSAANILIFWAEKEYWAI